MWYFYAVALPVTLGMVIYTLQHFASPKVARHVRIVVGYAWFVNMSIVILVPLDVWTTIRRENSKAGAICAQRPVINVLWSLPYWSAFFLTWLIIPMMQGYEDAADFTMGKRLKTSIRGNLIFYSSVGGTALVGAIILLTTKELAWDNLLGLAIGASNAFGLVTGALLLGFGLVEIPRGLWRHANLDERAKWLSHKVAKVAEKLDHAHQELSTAIVITQATSTQMSRRDRLRPMMDIIDAMASEDPTFKPSGGQLGNDLDYDTDEKSMAALRWRLRHAQEMYSRYKTEYTTVVWKALELEDTIKNYNSNDWRFVSRLRLERKGMLALPLDTAEWVWRCLVSQQLMRLLALILGLMSVAIIFAEATMLSQDWVDLSLFSILIRSAGLREEVVQLLVSIPLVYICVCTYFSVFKLGMFSFYYLVPHHTDSVSLLMNCSMVSRYAAPMCYNFLSLIHLTHYNQGTGKIESLVTCFEERMSVLPEEYERIYPLVMVVWCFLIASNVHNRILDVFGSWRRFRFESDGDVGEDDGASSAGLIILRRERASLDRGLAIGENVVPLARHFANGDDLETNLPMLPGEVQGDKASVSFHATNNGGKVLPAMTGLYAALKESAPKLPAIVTRDATNGKRPTTLRDTSHTRIANKYANLREGAKISTRTSSDDLLDLNLRASGRHNVSGGALKESTSSESIVAKPAELTIRPEARSPPLTSPRLGQESEGLLERQWDVMKSKLQGLAMWRTDSDPLSGDNVPRPAPNLDNIFEGLRANRRAAQEEQDDQDDTSYSLLRAAQKSSRENLHR